MSTLYDDFLFIRKTLIMPDLEQYLSLELQDFIPPKTNIVYAIDFDDCLMNEGVVQELLSLSKELRIAELQNLGPESEAYFTARLQAIIKHNRALLDEIYTPLPLNKFRKFATIFSNRQGKKIDGFNVRHKMHKDLIVGSCFSIFAALFPTSPLLRFLPILLTDCINDLTPGTTFNRLTDATYEGPETDPDSYEQFVKPTYSCPLDRYKIGIAYEQAHYMAATFPKDRNIIRVYDDNCEFGTEVNGVDQSLGILNQLACYYEANPSLLPNSVTLELYHYTGGERRLFKTITGTGDVDPNYARTLRRWTTATCPNWERQDKINMDYISGTRVLGLRATLPLQTLNAPSAEDLTTPRIYTTDEESSALRRQSLFAVAPMTAASTLNPANPTSSRASSVVSNFSDTEITAYEP